ncbi:NADH-quinone oxidoreductase subunit M [Hirschia baltica]|uniref:Proton-translocating NADH-quinone oxidoreductase, chain M n=1 Tax=Hirschia baltica (strain ATCC 49814 / DSM 5838 / IFAM 1418) TaxID=582402 RepID=C6XJX1_HIRBI|nr:NADH-quinone oxidoreductase subunit M [Hirschia baltica]ACT59416.1 proton-translocating NADH-quinone oxidoreductase, chain M [Hirschia baltica ATCC 49814]
MASFPILSMITFLPLVGALIILLTRAAVGEQSRETVRLAALVVTLATFVLSLWAMSEFNPSAPGYQLIEDVSWFGQISYKLGVDGMSMLLILLTTFLMPICVLASWNNIKIRFAEYMIAFLVLETLMLGVFCAMDLVLFYIFFEGGLIPMFIIIGIWGGANRLYAAFKFFLYTLLGSLALLAALIYIYVTVGTTDIPTLQQHAFAPEVQTWLWLAFFASFAVKLPMFPVHTWLPDAHVQAPTAGSVILAGVLLKMGGYGMLRFSLPMFPDASVLFQPLVFTLSVIAVIYASLVAFRQTDMKKLIAYSSVAHMGLVTLGIFAFNEEGIQGAIFQMFSHGLISSALFLCVGVVYDRLHTRDIAAYGGLVHRMPIYAALFMFFTMANVGLPGTSGFIGEIVSMVGGFKANPWAAAGAAIGMILSAVYMLTLFRATVFGVIKNPELEKPEIAYDVTFIEGAILAILAIGTLLLGVFPSLVFDISETSAVEILSLMSK